MQSIKRTEHFLSYWNSSRSSLTEVLEERGQCGGNGGRDQREELEGQCVSVLEGGLHGLDERGDPSIVVGLFER